MAPNFISGKGGGVNVGGVDQAFGKWTLRLKAELQRIKPFVTGANRGFNRIVVNFSGAEFTFEGDWDVGNMPIALGSTYTINFRVTDAITIPVTAVIGDIEETVDASKSPVLKVSGECDGSFTLNVS